MSKPYYQDDYVRRLFDIMSVSYSKMNFITSFGFSEIWRKQCVKKVKTSNVEVVIDLLSGMGECWKYIRNYFPKGTQIIALDFSEEMVKRATKRKEKYNYKNIKILEENIFNNSIKSSSADCVISTFGLKTFTTEQIESFAVEINRILKPGGRFSLVDVSVPPNRIIRFFYILYLKKAIPFFAYLFRINSQSYSMLGYYTENYGNSKEVEQIFKEYDFKIEYNNYFYGCASGISGTKLSKP